MSKYFHFPFLRIEIRDGLRVEALESEIEIESLSVKNLFDSLLLTNTLSRKE